MLPRLQNRFTTAAQDKTRPIFAIKVPLALSSLYVVVLPNGLFKSHTRPTPRKTKSKAASLMAYYHGRRNSIFDSLTLSPLPYPVLLILAVASVFLSFSWYVNYESAVEAAEEQLNWVLLVTPVVLIFMVRWLSTMETSDMFFSMSPWERRRRTHRQPSTEGGSPWGVAAFIVLLLVLVQFHSLFRESWLV